MPPPLSRQKWEHWFACSHYTHTRRNCKRTVSLLLFSFNILKGQMHLRSALFSSSVLKLKNCQMNHESCKHPRNSVRSRSIVHELYAQLSGEGCFHFKHKRTCRKQRASLQTCLKAGSLPLRESSPSLKLLISNSGRGREITKYLTKLWSISLS